MAELPTDTMGLLTDSVGQELREMGPETSQGLLGEPCYQPRSEDTGEGHHHGFLVGDRATAAALPLHANS